MNYSCSFLLFSSKALSPCQEDLDLVPGLEEAGVEYGWGVDDRHQVAGGLGGVHPRTQGRLGVPLHPIRDRLSAPTAPEVWEVGVLLPRGPSLEEHTELLEGGLLGQLHLDMEPAGEPRFQVELASKHRDGLQLDDILYMYNVTRYKSKGVSKKALGLGIGAGFLGGAALGVAGGMATASVYQRSV